MAGHTPEPWDAYLDGSDSDVRANGGETVICPMAPYTGSPFGKEAEANAKRIAACVNACKGINPEAVPELLEALNECFTDDGATCWRSKEFMIRRLQRINWLVKTAIAKATGQKPPVPSA